MQDNATYVLGGERVRWLASFWAFMSKHFNNTPIRLIMFNQGGVLSEVYWAQGSAVIFVLDGLFIQYIYTLLIFIY